MRPSSVRGLAPFLLALTGVAGCASSGMDLKELTARAYAEEIGSASYAALRRAVDRVVVDRHGYRLVREEEQYSTLYYETAWQRREPLADERDDGVTAARTRIVIRARRGEGELYGSTFEAENQVRTSRRPEWHARPVTEDFEVRMSRILRQIREALEGSALEARQRPAGMRCRS